ncbi:WD40 repeat-like protein [Basidiobolus meristosporus CBS 931.73]|uniref:WD40 repeat-like protein n=1 Tax=Basidiobolus meristosporus CBS 931.73 TaxID=1314790 RepID=A0A1Y1XSQ9_9FUNG|nr:WD40 repeat-like protein [Basidiobolus meristosporus CBS 931.73]|eukprot:ORX88725.1 WD40 repeat-like protein [Basidiobolus meristosporus CBS 931.73]
MSNIYNHRPMVPAGAGSRIPELLDALKVEFEQVNQDVSMFKMQRDEFEHKISAQLNEMTGFQQNLYELERTHQKIKQQYEEEILRLRRELEARGSHPQSGGTPHQTHKPAPPNIGHGPSNLFSGIMSGAQNGPNSLAAPPQMMDPNQQPQPQHPGYPGPGSGPPGLSAYSSGGPPGTPQQGPPPQGGHQPPNKRLRGDSDAPPHHMAGQSQPPMQQPSMYGSVPTSSPPVPGQPPNQLPGMMGQGPGQPPMGYMQGSPQNHPMGHQGPLTSQPPMGVQPDSQQGPPQNGPPYSGASPQGMNRKPSNGGLPPQQSAVAGPVRAPSAKGPGSANGSFNDVDLENLPSGLKREGSDWFAIFNPRVPRQLNVDLAHTLDHSSVVCCVRFSNDGKYLATGCNRSAQIYDVQNGSKICVLQDEAANRDGDLYIRAVCFSPDGKFLATGAEDKQIRIWDIARRRIRNLFQGHEQDIYSLDFSRDGRLVVSGSGDRTARIWDMDSGKCVYTLMIEENGPKEAGVTSVAFSPDGRLVAAGSLDKMVRVWDVQTGQLLEKLEGHKDSVYSIAFTPDGKSLISGSLDKTIKLWDILSSKNANNMGQKPNPCRTTFVGHKDFVLSVACSPCGNWIVSGSKDRGVQFWDPNTAHTQFMLQGHKNSVISINLSPVGGLFATASGDCRARLWSYESISPAQP